MSKDINLKDLNLKSLGPQLLDVAKKLGRYAGILFFVLVAGVYGFVVMRINSLSSLQPSSDQINTQSKAASIPKIDPKVVQQLESLKDNSVNVQTLFEQARDNPFQE